MNVRLILAWMEELVSNLMLEITLVDVMALGMEVSPAKQVRKFSATL